MRKIPIFYASVHPHDAESDMNIISKYNTYIINPIDIIKKLFISIFTEFRLLYTDPSKFVQKTFIYKLISIICQ